MNPTKIWLLATASFALIISLFVLSSCDKGSIKFREPLSVEEIHDNDALTLNELLIKLSGGKVWEQMDHSTSGLQSGESQRVSVIEKTGFTKDYIVEKDAKVYLNISGSSLPSGYYIVEAHHVRLEIPSEPFMKYAMLSSPKCGYIPASYSDQLAGKPNVFSNPLRGGFYDGKNSETANFHTFYIRVKYQIGGGSNLNRVLPEEPSNFVWRIAKKEE